jgi:DNA-binding NarL/FixJ family response regulator
MRATFEISNDAPLVRRAKSAATTCAPSTGLVISNDKLLNHALKELLRKEFCIDAVCVTPHQVQSLKMGLATPPSIILVANLRSSAACCSVLHALRERFGATPRLAVFTRSSLQDDGVACFQQYANGVLDERLDGNQAANNIKSILSGESVVNLLSTREIRGDEILRVHSLIDALKPRVRQVLKLMANGLSNRAISGRLGIAESTVKWYVTVILRALGLPNRFSVVAMFLQLEDIGLL